MAEKEYIEKNHLINTIINSTALYNSTVLKLIKIEPTADVQEVRHGKWLPMHYEYGILDGDNFDKCSVCGYGRLVGDIKYKTIYNYCPNCGAKMDKKGEGKLYE